VTVQRQQHQAVLHGRGGDLEVIRWNGRSLLAQVVADDRVPLGFEGLREAQEPIPEPLTTTDTIDVG
jgi:hypothetical protein